MAPHASSAPVRAHVRAAILLTGHLRATCVGSLGLRVLARQVASCRAVFDECDLFLHTWSSLDKAPEYAHGYNATRSCRGSCRWLAHAFNSSSLPCVAAISRAVGPLAAVTVERQEHAARPHAARTWNNRTGETLANFRMNGASMVAGGSLVRRHAEAMNRSYAAAVRMRADIGSSNIAARGAFSSQFLNNRSWASVRWHANATLRRRGARAPGARSGLQLFSCDRVGRRPSLRQKRVDFCFWSAPAAPVLDVLQALRAELSGDEAREAACRAYLSTGNLTGGLTQPITPDSVFSEHVLFCAMRRAAEVRDASVAPW